MGLPSFSFFPVFIFRFKKLPAKKDMPKWIVLATEAPRAMKKPIRNGFREGNMLPAAPAMTILEGPTNGIKFKIRAETKTPKYPRAERLSNNQLMYMLDSFASLKLYLRGVRESERVAR